MATLNSTQYQALEDKNLLNPAVYGGNLQHKYAEIELSAASIADIFKMVKVKEGEVVNQIEIHHDALGAGVTLDVGDVASTTRYVTAQAAATAGIIQIQNIAGFGYQYTSDDDLQIVLGGGAATGTIKLILSYVPVSG